MRFSQTHRHKRVYKSRTRVGVRKLRGGPGACAAWGGRPGGSAAEEQHPLRAGLAHEAGVLQHGGLLARLPLLPPEHAVRQDGLLVQHLQPVGVRAATFIRCNNKTRLERHRAQPLPNSPHTHADRSAETPPPSRGLSEGAWHEHWPRQVRPAPTPREGALLARQGDRTVCT